jgi:hypothetical protein
MVKNIPRAIRKTFRFIEVAALNLLRVPEILTLFVPEILAA